MKVPKHVVITDLGFGDAGKGSVCDWFARQHTDVTVVRYNGGSQAAHHVVTDQGHTHCFAQWGAGTLAGARTHLSRFMLFNPANFAREREGMPYSGRTDQTLVTIDPRAKVITSLHRRWNQIQEQVRGVNRHGSCGQGIGATVEASLRWPETVITFQDLFGGAMDLADKIEVLYRNIQDEIEALGLDPGEMFDRILVHEAARDLLRCGPSWTQQYKIRMLRDEELDTSGSIIFEGAQGVLLDEDHGFQPHTTWSKTTDLNATVLAKEWGIDPVHIGVCRTYMTRHGAGPFPTEDELVTATRHETHNGTGQFQDAWRAGFLDLPLLRYAIACCERIDALAVTHVDRVPLMGWQVCDRYTRAGDRAIGIDPERIGEYKPGYSFWDPAGYAERMAEELHRPLALTSHGPTASGKQWRL